MTPPSVLASGTVGSSTGLDTSSPNNMTLVREGHARVDAPTPTYQGVQTVAIAQPSRVTSFLDRSRNSLFPCLPVLASIILFFLCQQLSVVQLLGYLPFFPFSNLVKWNLPSGKQIIGFNCANIFVANKTCYVNFWVIASFWLTFEL